MQWPRAGWPNFSIRAKTSLAVLLPMGALLLSWALIAWVSLQHQAANEWVIHTLEVRLALASFDRQFGAAETSLRNYPKLSASESQPAAKRSLAEAQKVLGDIQKLTYDNPNQRRRISELESLLDNCTSLLDSSLRVQSATAQRQAHALSSQIVRIAAEMDEEEIRLLSSRTNRSGELQTILWLVISATLLVGILGTLIGTTLLANNVSKRLALLAESSVLIGEGLPVKPLDSSRDEIGQLASTLAQTSRVLSERAAEIAEVNWKLESVLRAATAVSIIVEDQNGRISLFSTGASRVLGYRPEEAMGRNFVQIVRPSGVNAEQDLSRRQSSASRIPGRAGCNEFETVYVRKDGVPLDVYVSITPLKSISGKLIGRLHVAHDITPRKLLEAELRRKIDVLKSEKDLASSSDEREKVDLPEWLSSEGSRDVEHLSSKLRVLNDWYEAHGHIPNAAQGKRADAVRILIVDDFEPTRFLLRAYLQDEGYELDFACTGKEALEKAAEHTYDLVLMDVEMPQMNGYEAASRIRNWEKSQGRSPIPIVALSAHDQDESETATVWTSHIQKPVSKEQLLEKVRRYVEVKCAG